MKKFILAPTLFILSCVMAPQDEETPQPDDPPHVRTAKQILSEAKIALEEMRLDKSTAETEITKAKDSLNSQAQTHYNTLKAALDEAEGAYRLTRTAFREIRKASEEKAIQDLLTKAKRGLANLASIHPTVRESKVKLISALYQRQDDSVGYEANESPNPTPDEEASPLD